jgi:FtsZ-interacting cell division protein ZipA
MDAWIWIVIAVVVVALIAFVGYSLWSRSRRRRLSQRFGDEYGRTLDTADSRRQGERELRERETEHEELQLRPLTDSARERYANEWSDLQARFVDRPQAAVIEADDLVAQVMQERGYPVDDFETRSRLVSVDQPEIVENYRQGHEIALKARSEETSTEDLRQALVNYRALFDELLRDGSDA